MKIFYFTATGNSLYVAKKIGGELYSLPAMLKEKKFDFEDEAIGIIFPCYFFGMPRLVEEFMKKAKLKADYLFAVITYGNMSGGAAANAAKTAQKYGIKFDYANNILMVDNFIPYFDIDEELKNEENKNIEPNLYLISSDIRDRKRFINKKSFAAEKASRLVNMFMAGRMTGEADKNFTVNDKCTRCMTCIKVCPKNNIALENKPQYLHKCDYCMACINLCPENAIHVKNEKSDARFLNSKIKTAEIILSNNQQNQ